MSCIFSDNPKQNRVEPRHPGSQLLFSDPHLNCVVLVGFKILTFTQGAVKVLFPAQAQLSPRTIPGDLFSPAHCVRCGSGRPRFRRQGEPLHFMNETLGKNTGVGGQACLTPLSDLRPPFPQGHWEMDLTNKRWGKPAFVCADPFQALRTERQAFLHQRTSG